MVLKDSFGGTEVLGINLGGEVVLRVMLGDICLIGFIRRYPDSDGVIVGDVGTLFGTIGDGILGVARGEELFGERGGDLGDNVDVEALNIIGGGDDLRGEDGGDVEFKRAEPRGGGEYRGIGEVETFLWMGEIVRSGVVLSLLLELEWERFLLSKKPFRGAV